MVIFGICVILIIGYVVGVYLLIGKADKDNQALSDSNAELKKTLAQKPIEENVLKEKIEHVLEEKKSVIQDLEKEKLESGQLKNELDNAEKEKNLAIQGMEKGKAELSRLKSEADHEAEMVKEKEREKERLGGQLEQIRNEMVKLKTQANIAEKTGAEFQILENVVEEQMEYAREISQGIDKNRVTMKLLDEKSKENSELMKQLSD